MATNEERKLYDPVDNSHLEHLSSIAQRDAQGLLAAHKHYGNSWKKRGGVSSSMMIFRKIDRLEKFLEEHGWDIFRAMDADTRGEGIIDDIRDLRRYLLLVEAEARARGIECAQATHRDNIVETAKAAEERYGGREMVVNVDGLRVVKGGPDDDKTWHPDHEAPDRRAVDRDPGPSGSMSDPQGRS